MIFSVLTDQKSLFLNVGVFGHFGKTFLVLCHKVQHSVRASVENVAADNKTFCGVVVAPSLYESRRVGIVPLLPPTVSRKAYNVSFYPAIGNKAFVGMLGFFKEIFMSLKKIFQTNNLY